MASKHTPYVAANHRQCGRLSGDQHVARSTARLDEGTQTDALLSRIRISPYVTPHCLSINRPHTSSWQKRLWEDESRKSLHRAKVRLRFPSDDTKRIYLTSTDRWSDINTRSAPHGESTSVHISSVELANLQQGSRRNDAALDAVPWMLSCQPSVALILYSVDIHSRCDHSLWRKSVI